MVDLPARDAPSWPTAEEPAVKTQRRLDPRSELWQRVLESAGQPA